MTDKKDMRATAHEWAGPGFEPHVDAAAKRMHANRSLHTHTLGTEQQNHGACGNCWYDAGMAVQALRLANLLPSPPSSREYAWHTITLYMGETPFDVGPQLLVDVEHDPSCQTLPLGAHCWYDRYARDYDNQTPHEPGTYRVRLDSVEVGDHNGEFSHVDDYLDVQQRDEQSGDWKPWFPAPMKDYGYALWDIHGRLRVMTMDRAALEAWRAENLSDVVTNLELLDENSYQTLTRLLAEIRWKPERTRVRDIFNARRGQWPTPPCGWAAWAGDGTLIALGTHVPGRTGWHSLGIGKAADDVVLDGLGVAHYELLQTMLDTDDPHRPGGRELFLRRRAEIDDTTHTPTTADGRLMSHTELTGALADVLACVSRSDSAEGFVRWEPSDDPDRRYVVNASYRVGTSSGQGGSIVIGAEHARG